MPSGRKASFHGSNTAVIRGKLMEERGYSVQKFGSYTKLKDGNWGVRISGIAQAGNIVSVRTKAGDTKQEMIDKVLWTGPDRSGDTVSLCTVSQRSRDSGGGKECVTGGNCSSFGDGRGCGGRDCDGY